MDNPVSSNVDFEHMFALAPVSLWLEDFSALRSLFVAWRDAGVTDLRTHLAAHPDGLRECTACLRVLQVNQRTLELFAAASQQELLGQVDKVFRGDMHDHVVHELEALWSGALEYANLTVNYTLDGRRLDVQVRVRILPGHETTWSRVLVSLEDVTAEVQAQARIAQGERYARSLFEHSPVSLWVEDFSSIKRLMDDVRRQGIRDFKTFIKVHPEFVDRCMKEIRVIDVNQETLSMFGAHSKAELLNQIGRVFRDEMHDSFAEQLQDLWDGKLVQQREVVNYALSGEPVNIHMQFSVMEGHEDDWSLVLLSLVDITARKQAEAYLEYLGKHDVLTQLRNRAFYVEELNRIRRKGPWPLGILAIDLNGLKHINDEHGHAAGDALLRRAGEVLAKAVDATHCAARVGGDEFIVLLPGGDERGTLAVQERIASLVEMNNQFYPGQHLSLAMGNAICHAGESLDDAVQRADAHMYQEKKRYYEEKALDRRHPGP